MVVKLSTFDPAEYLETDDDIAFFLNDALATGNPGYIAHAVGVVARAKGMTDLAKKTGIAREQLYRSFSGNGNPTLKTTFAVLEALGIKLTTKPACHAHA